MYPKENYNHRFRCNIKQATSSKFRGTLNDDMAEIMPVVPITHPVSQQAIVSQNNPSPPPAGQYPHSYQQQPGFLILAGSSNNRICFYRRTGYQNRGL